MKHRALWVIPSLDRAWGDECLAGLRAANVLRLDNAPPNHNRGVAASWNEGAQVARSLDAEYLVICSEAIRFGPAGGLDLEDRLDGTPLVLTMCKGFHLVAVSVATLDAVGAFDENLYPAYGEDRDFLIRLGLAGLPAPGYNDLPVPQYPVDVTEAGVAHSILDGHAEVSFGAMTRYLAKKWGGTRPGEHFDHPFGDSTHDWRWWPPLES